MHTANLNFSLTTCILALCAALTAAGPALAAEGRAIETLNESGTNTQPHVRVSPTGEGVHYYVPNGNRNPYTSQHEQRVNPPVGFGQSNSGNYYGAQGGTNYPNQSHLDPYAR